MGRVALVERELGNLEAAEKLLATAETKIENTAPAPVAWLYVQRGLIHLEAGRTKQALRFLRAAHERATGYPLAVVALARAELVGGEAKRAVELLEPLVEEWPRALHHRWLAAAYAAAGRNTDAEGEWRRAESSCEAHFPKFPEAVAATCAEVSLERGNRAGALRYAAAAVKASPSRANRALLKAAADP